MVSTQPIYMANPSGSLGETFVEWGLKNSNGESLNMVNTSIAGLDSF